MRRLPVFFLIDVSESMIGDPIKNVNTGIHQIISKLKSNPMALETAYLSIIAFAGKPKLMTPLTDLLSFTIPDLFIGGGTALGSAMNFLMDELENNVQKTTYEMKGDWKPIIFLFTDGAPTDEATSAITRWKSEFTSKATLVAISIGDQADIGVLNKFTDKVFIFNHTDADSYAEFFNWVSASIETNSVNIVSHNADEFQLPEADMALLQKENIFRPDSIVDERFLILLARCQQAKKPYLIKFVKDHSEKYCPEGAYSISESYFSISSEDNNLTMRSDLLNEIPICPQCSNKNLAYCACGRLFCFGETEKSVCPWCNNEIKITYSSSFDINRAQG